MYQFFTLYYESEKADRSAKHLITPNNSWSFSYFDFFRLHWQYYTDTTLELYDNSISIVILIWALSTCSSQNNLELPKLLNCWKTNYIYYKFAAAAQDISLWSPLEFVKIYWYHSSADFITIYNSPGSRRSGEMQRTPSNFPLRL